MSDIRRGWFSGAKTRCANRLLISALLILSAAGSQACSLCAAGPPSSRPQPTLAAVAGDSFLPNLIATATPFLFFGAVTVLIRFGFPEVRAARPRARVEAIHKEETAPAESPAGIPVEVGA